jgi:hypothetical protein
MIIFRLIIPRISVLDKSRRENQNKFYIQDHFPENRDVYETI